jgi:hypothetical protein
VSSAAIAKKIEEAEKCVRDMRVLDDWTIGLGRKVAERADRFAGVKVDGKWSGAAADRFSKVLAQNRDKVTDAGKHAKHASAVIQREIALKTAEIAALKVEYAAALAWEAVQRAAKDATR